MSTFFFVIFYINSRKAPWRSVPNAPGPALCIFGWLLAALRATWAWIFKQKRPRCFFWNYNELTASSLEIIVSKGNHPQMALIQVSE